MLNSKGNRELAYVVKVDSITPIEGADRVELAHVGGWTIMVKKNQFKAGDYAIYFEIDSKVPETEPFMFLESKHFRVKTQKYFKGTVYSQGLLMSFDDFENGENTPAWLTGLKFRIAEGKDVEHEFLTEVLGVTYAIEEDNKRKANSPDKYKVMTQRRPDIFKRPWAQWFMRRSWGRRIMFFLFGKKKDKKAAWPNWVKKTDEERIENCTFYLKDKNPWVATEKIDGTSTTATYRKTGKKKHEFYVCSRNVVFEKPDQPCFYDTNIYTTIAEKYHFEEALADIVDKYNLEWATIQGEIFGKGVQKREYSMENGQDFCAFNLIFSNKGRLSSIEGKNILSEYDIPWVPIIQEEYILPDTVEELRNFVESAPSAFDGKMKEGIVFRSLDGQKSFKCVSPNYLIKYHQ